MANFKCYKENFGNSKEQKEPSVLELPKRVRTPVGPGFGNIGPLSPSRDFIVYLAENPLRG